MAVAPLRCRTATGQPLPRPIRQVADGGDEDSQGRTAGDLGHGRRQRRWAHKPSPPTVTSVLPHAPAQAACAQEDAKPVPRAAHPHTAGRCLLERGVPPSLLPPGLLAAAARQHPPPARSTVHLHILPASWAPLPAMRLAARKAAGLPSSLHALLLILLAVHACWCAAWAYNLHAAEATGLGIPLPGFQSHAILGEWVVGPQGAVAHGFQRSKDAKALAELIRLWCLLCWLCLC